MSDTYPTCGSDDKKVRVPTLVSPEGHCSCYGNIACVRTECVMDGLGRCPEAWHDEQPTTPEDAEAALERIKCALFPQEDWCWRVEQDDTVECGCMPCIPESLATLRAHIERADACLKAAHERADKHINARFALQRRAEAAEQRVAVLEAVREAAKRYAAIARTANATTRREIDAQWKAMGELDAALAAAEES